MPFFRTLDSVAKVCVVIPSLADIIRNDTRCYWQSYVTSVTRMFDITGKNM